MVKREAIVGFCRYWKMQEYEQQVEYMSRLGNELKTLEQKYQQNQINKIEYSQQYGTKSLQFIQLRRLATDSMQKTNLFQQQQQYFYQSS